MHKALHPRYDYETHYMSRKEEGRLLASIEDSVEASRLEDYIEKRRGGLITATRKRKKKHTNNTKKRRPEITSKQKWEENQLHGRFKRLTSDISHEKTWKWLKKETLSENESLLIVAQNNAIRTNHIKSRIDKTQQNSK